MAFLVLLTLLVAESSWVLITSRHMGKILDSAVTVAARKLDRAYALDNGINDLVLAAKGMQASWRSAPSTFMPAKSKRKPTK